MGIIANLQNFIVMGSNNYIFVVSKKSSDSDVTTLELPVLRKCQAKNTKTSNVNSSDDIVSVVASRDEEYLAAATFNKRLIVWKVSTWSVHKEETLVKRTMAMTFSSDSSSIIVADKNGDVYSYPLNDIEISTDDQPRCDASGIDVEPGPEPLLGHLSMLLDLALTNDGKFLITSDRDEKIRVSSYPNCYNIHTFCLGHKEFVSHIRVLPDRNDRLLSASGDGRLILWNYLKGEISIILDVRDKIESLIRSHFHLENAFEQLKLHLSSTYISNFEVASISSERYILAISFYRLPVLIFYEINCVEESFSYLYSHKLSFPPFDFEFLERRELLVFMNTWLEDGQKNSLAILRISEDYREVQIVSEHFILNFGEDYRERLTPKNDLTLDVSSLFKHNKYDNVADYLKKKQERLSSCSKATKRKSDEI